MIEDDEIPEQVSRRPWPFWPTLGFSLIVAIAMIVVQIIVVTILAVLIFNGDKNIDSSQFEDQIANNGLIMAIATCAGAPVVIGLILLFARLRKGISIKEYLGFNSIRGKTIFLWLLALLLLVAISDGLTYLLGYDVIPEFMVKATQTAGFIPLLWFAIVIIAPFTEELFFRGFLFEGFRNSALKPVGAIIATSLIWSLIHTQYDFYMKFIIFILGIFLGYARIKSESVVLPMILHAAASTVATIEGEIYMRYFLN